MIEMLACQPQSREHKEIHQQRLRDVIRSIIVVVAARSYLMDDCGVQSMTSFPEDSSCSRSVSNPTLLWNPAWDVLLEQCKIFELQRAKLARVGAGRPSSVLCLTLRTASTK